MTVNDLHAKLADLQKHGKGLYAIKVVDLSLSNEGYSCTTTAENIEIDDVIEGVIID